jgi:hypothetical protein
VDDLGGDPPEVDQGLHWYDREPCPFTREEGEVHGTYVATTMPRNEGDDMLKWASNHAYRPQRLRFRNIRSLSRAVARHYVPEGVKGINFHERLDGHQNVMFYYRDLLPCIVRLLSRPKYANTVYTRFRLVRDQDGVRIYGAFNTGSWYQFAHVTAQTKGDGRPVSVVSLFGSTDVSIARKKMAVYPFFFASGCIGDRNMSEPSSWMMVACLPHYNDKAARAAGRIEEGPHGIRRRKVLASTVCVIDCLWFMFALHWQRQMELTHLGIAVIMDDYNEISRSTLVLRFPDGIQRESYIMWAGWIADQQEMDRICCETSQKCKQCVAPKNRLHEPHTVFARRNAKDVERAVRDAALNGKLPGLAPGPPLFKLGTDPRSKRPRWIPTPACTTKRYEDARTALGGVHLIENGLWRARHFDYLMQVYSLFVSGLL